MALSAGLIVLYARHVRALPWLLALALVACGHCDPGRSPADDAEIVRRLDAYADQLAGAGRFSGALAVAKDGKPLLQRAWGLASRAWSSPNRTETRFNLGSMNKMFTAVAIGQLLERNKLALDDTVGKHLPDFGNVEVRRKVTIRHLLTHTSGLGSYFNDEFEAKKLRIREVQDYLPIIERERLASEPGARWS